MKLAIAVLLAALLPTAALAAGNLDARIAASAAAAQALQGPLDGAWALVDVRGRPIVLLQVADPVGRPADLQAAWQVPGVGAAIRPVDRFTRRDDRIWFEFATAALSRAQAELRLRGGVWRGRLNRDGRIQAVKLVRAAASAATMAVSE